jgi:hypothetical protein
MTRLGALIVLLCIVVSVDGSLRLASAEWPTDPNVNLPIATVPYQQIIPDMAPDGFGGFIVVWEGWRDSNTYWDIFAQRITLNGNSQWMANGIQVSSASGFEVHARVVQCDDASVIVAWSGDLLDTDYDIYAQRIDAFGNPMWDARGVPICTASGDQDSLAIVSDGAGGAIVMWRDHRLFGTSKSDLFAQRISSSGVTQWQPDGVAVCTAPGEQKHLRAVPDGNGGASISWEDWRNIPTSGSDIFVQRIAANGVPYWPVNGVAACDHSGWQRSPSIAAAGDDVVMVWQDDRNPEGIFAQRISSSGNQLWVDDGVVVCALNGTQTDATVIPAGAGGVYVAWADARNGNPGDIYAQRIDALGVSIWAPNGVPVCLAAGVQSGPKIVSDNAGGLIVGWKDYRAGSTADIYAQRVRPNGAVAWTSNGVAISTAANAQLDHTMLPDGLGGAFFAWEDHRQGGALGEHHIYCQRADSTGILSTPTAVQDRSPSLSGLQLGAPIPNPTGDVVRVPLQLQSDSAVEVRVYDVRGKEVWSRGVASFKAGETMITVPGIDRAGRSLPQGVYFVTAKSNGNVVTQKFTIVR